MKKKIDLIAVGELLADFITVDECDSLFEGEVFTRYQGGSPANLAANLARLGKTVTLVSSVGADGVGRFLINEISKTGISTDSIAVQNSSPTSLVLVSRTSGTPDFVAYRLADCMLKEEDIPLADILQTRLFHTTCFALSMQPARNTILNAAGRALETGAFLSIDLNYHPQIWPDRDDAIQVVSRFCSANTLVKCSIDDMERLLGN
ncbi:MAG: PfkB family carbohydrate kinase, partial [Calditrichota bacterium]